MTGLRIALDTDPGADDAIALIWLCALRHMERVQLVNVSTVGGNVGIDQTTLNAERLLHVCDADDVALSRGLGAGGEQARHVHGQDGLAGLRSTLQPGPTRARESGAVETLTHIAPKLDALIAVGPLTNLAAAHWPDDAHARVVVMGGALEDGNITPYAEFNVYHDPASWRTCLTRYRPDVVPLNVTRRVFVDPMTAARVRRGPLGHFVSALFERMCQDAEQRTGVRTFLLHDAVAVAAVCYPGLLTFRSACLDVVVTGERRGAVVERPDDAPNARVAVDVDADALVDTMLRDINAFCDARDAIP